MGEKRLTWTVGFGDETRAEMRDLHPGWGDRDLAAEVRRIGEQEIHERWMRHRYPPTPPPVAPLEPTGAEMVGPAATGVLDLTKLDELPDPGTEWTAKDAAVCALCKAKGADAVIPAGARMIIRTKADGGRQYLHAWHATEG